MAATLLLSFLAAACAEVYDINTGSSAQLSNAATMFLSQGKVDESSSIACFADEAEGEFGICTLLTLEDDGNLSAESNIVFNSNATQHVSVATFGDTGAALVCYSDAGGNQHVTCRVIDVRSGNMTKPVQVSGETMMTSSISVTNIGDSKGLVCFSCTACSGMDAPEGQCAVLFVVASPSVQLLAGDAVPFSNPAAAAEISTRGFGEKSAVVCYSQAGQGICTLVEVTSDTPSFASASVVIARDDAENSSVSIAKLTDESGVVCFADGETNGNYAACGALTINGSVLSVGSALRVSAGYSSSVSVASLTRGLAIVCYVGLDELGGPSTCRLLSVDELRISAGPASVVSDAPTARLVLAGLAEDVAAICYSNQRAGYSFCVALSVDPAATTGAPTEAQGSSTAVPGTSVSSTFLATTPEPAQRATEFNAAGRQLLPLGWIRLLAAAMAVGALY